MPADWPVVPLGDVIDVKHGFAFKGKYFTTERGPIVMTPGNFHDDGGFKFKNPEKFYCGQVPDGYTLSSGDLLVAMTEQKRGLLGSAALVPCVGTFLHNQRLGLVVEKRPSEVSRRFLYYIFNAPYVRSQIQATANGAKVRHTSPSRLKEVEVRLPPLVVQRKIAAVLAAYDELIENNLRRIEILEGMAQVVYREWFVNFRFPGHEDVAMVDSPLGPIPEGWSARTFGDLAENQRTNVNPLKSPEEQFDHFSFAAFDESGLPTKEPGESMKSAKLLVEADSVLLAKLNPRIPRVWFARPSGNRRSVASSEFLVLGSRSGTALELVYAVCRDRSFQVRLATMSGGTSTSHQRLKLDELMLLPLPLAPEGLVQAFAEVTRPVYRLVANLTSQNASLRTTRDLLLPKLVSGELDVSDLNIDTEWLSP